MNLARKACVIGMAIVASTLHAQHILEDFESHQIGAFPGGEWHDITDRTVGSPTVSPTMSVIETVDAHGNPTLAVQTNQEPGTNGLYQDVSTETTFHHLTMDVRVDSMHSVNAGWPVSMGYSRYLGQDDVNANPQGLIYVWTGRVWNLFITPGGGRPAVDLRINGPQLVVGRWYTLSLDVEVQTGHFEAKVFDAVTGELLNSLSYTYPQWNPEIDSYNSITVFDGGNVNSPVQGQSTIDNVQYEHSNSSQCLADLNMDGEYDFLDISAFISALMHSDPIADLNKDDEYDFLDISAFLSAFASGCP